MEQIVLLRTGIPDLNAHCTGHTAVSIIVSHTYLVDWSRGKSQLAETP